MMMDQEVSGYDTAFTTRLRRDGRLELDVDLPDEAFPPEEGDMATTNNEPGTRKLDSSTSTTIPSTVSGHPHVHISPSSKNPR
ncbi:hypothetical protein FRC12_005819 [Ceratobasidium sp. 428]|nr:hypothetical protein FRC12_005819 [Ceratobasidium sp. 428]